jgi:hypothetical protein
MALPHRARWLVWGGIGCGCLVGTALAFVWATAYLATRIAARHAARDLLRPAAAPPVLEAGIEVVAAGGEPLPQASAAANYRYTVKLRNTGASALLVQQVRVSFLDASGQELGSAVLRNSIVAPGEPQAFAGEARLTPEALGQVATVKASVIPTPLGR